MDSSHNDLPLDPEQADKLAASFHPSWEPAPAAPVGLPSDAYASTIKQSSNPAPAATALSTQTSTQSPITSPIDNDAEVDTEAWLRTSGLPSRGSLLNKKNWLIAAGVLTIIVLSVLAMVLRTKPAMEPINPAPKSVAVKTPEATQPVPAQPAPTQLAPTQLAPAAEPTPQVTATPKATTPRPSPIRAAIKPTSTAVATTPPASKPSKPSRSNRAKKRVDIVTDNPYN